MLRIIKICSLCIALNVLLKPQAILSQLNIDSLQVKSYELGNVFVTAGRTPIEAQKAARIVTTISKTEIQKLPANNINDLLRFVPGVDIRQRGPLGAQADISIRGGTYDQTLILLNGVNITDPQTGHHNLNIPVDLESIERIEILQGPAAKSFGPNAFNGAINVITGSSSPDHIRISAMYGENGLYRTSLNISNSVKEFSHFLSLGRMSSKGYIHNTDFLNSNIFYQATYRVRSGEFDFQAGYSSRDFGANSFYSLKYPDQFEATRTEFASIKYQSNTRIKFTPVLYLRRNLDRFELKRNDNSFPFNHHRTTVAGVNLNLHSDTRIGKISAGIDFRNENIKSTVLGNISLSPLEVRNFDNTFYSKDYNRFNNSIYAEHSLSLDKFMVTSGIMVHNNSDLTGLHVYPGFDLSYRLGSYFRIYSSFNKTLRMPTFTDMFYRSPVQQGNRYLKPEEARSLEGGLKFNNGTIKSYVNGFRRRGYNMIDWVKDISPDSTIWRSTNFSEINFTGFEGSLTINPEGSRIESLRLSYTFLKADTIRPDKLSKYALDYLKHQVTAGIDIRIVSKLYNSTRLTWHDRESVYQDARGQIVKYHPFWLADTKLYWKEKHFSFYAEATNIFNSSYYDIGGIIQPGIWMMTGITMDFDFKTR